MRALNVSSPILWILAGAAILAYSLESGAATHKATHVSFKHNGRNLNFDGSTVEALNRRPLDSLNQFGEADKSGSERLYQKRKDFNPETQDELQALRYEK